MKSSVSRFEVEFESPDYMRNPYPFYEEFLRGGGFWRHPETGTVYLGRYSDVEPFLRDRRQFRRESRGRNPLSAEGGEPNFIENVIRDWMVFRDPPGHTRVRSVLKHPFTPRRIASLRPRIEAVVDELLDELGAKTSIDVISDLAYEVPIVIICEMMAIPMADHGIFRQWSRRFARAVDRGQPSDIERGIPASKEFYAYLEHLIRERRGKTGDDLISILIRAQESEGGITNNELVANCINLIFAGHETTKNLIGAGLLLLHDHPDQQRLLRDQPDLIEGAVEEFLRMESPVQMITRWAVKPLTIAGHEVAEDQDVVGLVGAANRDPAAFDDPGTMNIRRNPNKHLAFGLGIHHCLGATLARLETAITVSRFLARYPTYEPDAEPQWCLMAGFRTLDQLYLRVA